MANESISRSLATTRKKTPTGDSLCHNIFFFNQSEFNFQKTKFFFHFSKNKFLFAYQITQCVMIIMASLVENKNLSNGLPFSPNFPSAVPNTTLNITTPRTFVVAEFTCLKFHRCNGAVCMTSQNVKTKKKKTKWISMTSEILLLGWTQWQWHFYIYSTDFDKNL